MFSKLKYQFLVLLTIFFQVKYSDSISCYDGGFIGYKLHKKFELIECGPNSRMCVFTYLHFITWYEHHKENPGDLRLENNETIESAMTKFCIMEAFCENPEEPVSDNVDNCCEERKMHGGAVECNYEVCDTDGCNSEEVGRARMVDCRSRAMCPPYNEQASQKSTDTDIAFRISPNEYLLFILIIFPNLLIKLN